MKKWIAFLCTLSCILCLTACGGSGENVSEYQKTKLDYAQGVMAEQTINVLQYLGGAGYEAFAMYSNEELEYLMENQYGLLVDGYGVKTAMESFRLSGDTTGAVVEITESVAEAKDSQIIVNVKAHCEKKDATIELIFSNDMFLRLEGAALNPVSSKGELMEKAALNTVLGMGTVFLVLILISAIIASFALIPKIQAAFAKKDKEKENSDNITGIDNAVAQIAQQEEVAAEDDTELVAVIAAAIAAYEGSTNTEGFVVRSIRRR